MNTELFIINGIVIGFMLLFIALVARAGLYSELNRSFFYFSLALLVWLTANYLSNQVVFGGEALLLINRLLFAASALTVALMLRFCVATQQTVVSKQRRQIALGLTLLAVGISLTPGVAETVLIQENFVGIGFGVLSPLYFAILAVLAVAIMTSLIHGMRQVKGIARSRARLLLFSFGVTLGLITLTNVILPIFNSFFLSTIGPLFSVILFVGVGYGIVKYRLFDIRLFVTRSLAYVFTITVLAMMYSLVTFGMLSRITDSSLELSHELPYFVVALLLGLTFNPLKHFFDKVSDRIFYKDKYDVQEVLDKFNHLIISEIRLSRLLGKSIQLIGESLKPEFVHIILIDDKGRVISQASTEKGSQVEIKRTKQMLPELDRMPSSMLINTNIRQDKHYLGELYICMDKTDTEVITKLKTPANSSIGYILFGHKRSSGTYSSQDVRMMGLISSELAVAIQNGLQFQEISAFNETLQAKVDTATQKLRNTNQKLKQLDIAKDEFVSMASHQLRTPLTSVKGYLSMVLEGDAGKLNPTQEKLLKEAFVSSERMVRLIGDFLNVSRLRTGKFIIENVSMNLADAVQEEIQQLRATASSRGLTLEYERPASFPVIHADRNKLQQVVMNFVDNAIFYSHAGGTIRLELLKNDNYIIFRVKDNGIGVPNKEKQHLFTKFFRASNARRQRPDGTGIGLFMAQKIIVAHGGSIIFESTEGKGSTFGFQLPLVTPPVSQKTTK